MPGDVNDDGQVNATDFNVIAANYNQHVTGWANGDLNGDGVVNAEDFALLASNYGQPDKRTLTQNPVSTPIDLEAGCTTTSCWNTPTASAPPACDSSGAAIARPFRKCRSGPPLRQHRFHQRIAAVGRLG